MKELHQPVLLEEVLSSLAPSLNESYLDLTAGYAGHASKILAVTQNYRDAVLVDRDKMAIDYLTEKYQGESVKIIKSDFYSAALQQIECGNTFDLILGDFGVSSLQLDRSERGFAFSQAGPLDMRMDQSQKLDAGEIVNHWSERRLIELIMEYGEESKGRAQWMARKIVHGRPWQDTQSLASAMTGGVYHKTHPATRLFQAVRIVVNDELGLIKKTLPELVKLLKPGGRLGLISFHSLEDRLVKEFFKEQSSFGEESKLQLLNKTPIVAGPNELAINPRARSAKLRIAIRR
ncbi:MAG: 16S rRNA (cytosine(1402)-N(4))-methyltransferase RsmH [Candidatus Saccharibacteria bacterium]|nr:16S rRNA (cytosine(1402)-N(4))-methyltransferase RsmH [Candidatus Saccharibacteria bacterium]